LNLDFIYCNLKLLLEYVAVPVVKVPPLPPVVYVVPFGFDVVKLYPVDVPNVVVPLQGIVIYPVP
jgi:hypothetical protein